MAENIQNAVDQMGISNAVEIDFDEQYGYDLKRDDYH